MVAADFLQDPRVQGWLDGVEPAWTLLTFESLLALRHEPSAVQSAIQIANDLSVGEIAGSPVARNTLILLGQAIERVGLPLTATGNLSRATVAEMCKLIEWPDYDQADAFRLNKVINEPDFLPLHVVRQLAQAATLVRVQRGKLVATPLGKSILSDAKRGSLLAALFHLAFWRMDLSYFGRGLLGSWPQADAGVMLWSLSVCANDWQSAEKLTRLCTIPERECPPLASRPQRRHHPRDAPCLSVGRAAIDKVMKQQPAVFLKLLVLLVPREMRVEHSGGVKSMADEELERGIEMITASVASQLTARTRT
jgi:hypothetical protein